MTYCVYEHWRSDKSACFYVGKGNSRRPREMRRGRSARHSRIVKKLAKAGLAVEVRIVAAGISEQDAFALEKERIAFWRKQHNFLVNITDGGEGVSGRPVSPETRLKISLALMGHPVSAEIRAASALANKGKTLSVEHRAAISKRHKGVAKSAEHNAKVGAANRGRRMTDAQKLKLSLANIGKIPSVTARAKMSSSALLGWEKRRATTT